MRATTPCLLLAAIACTSPDELPTPVDPPEVAALDDAVAAWKASPSALRVERVAQAAEAVIKAPSLTASAEIRLGDALSNIVLRPDLGLPYLERNAGVLTEDQEDAYLDAIARSQDLRRLQREIAERRGLTVGIDHQMASSVVHQAAVSSDVHWRHLPEHVDIALFTERMANKGRAPLDRPVVDTGDTLEVLAVLVPDVLDLTVAYRVWMPTDPDPNFTPGTIATTDQQFRVLGYVHGADRKALRALGEELDVQGIPMTQGFGARLRSADGAELTICGRGVYRPDGDLWLSMGCGAESTLAWEDAAEAWALGRARGDDETALQNDLVAQYRPLLLGAK